MESAPPPLIGFNNNVRYRGMRFHIQTEDSGVTRPHVITHVFADGGQIIKSMRTDYTEYVNRPDRPVLIQRLMREQHRAMALDLRDGRLDATIDQLTHSAHAAEESDPPDLVQPSPPPSAPEAPARRAASISSAALEAATRTPASSRTPASGRSPASSRGPASSHAPADSRGPASSRRSASSEDPASSHGSANSQDPASGQDSSRSPLNAQGPTSSQRPSRSPGAKKRPRSSQAPAKASRSQPPATRRAGGRPSAVLPGKPSGESIFGALPRESLDEVILSYVTHAKNGPPSRGSK